MPAAPYPIARVFTVIVTAFIWFWVLLIATWVFAGGSQTQYVSTRALANISALTLLLIPFFVTQGVHTHMLDAIRRERMLLPNVTQDAAARSTNPWRAGVINMLVLGVAAAVAGYFMASTQPSLAITPGAFALRLAQVGSALCLLTAWLASGSSFVNDARVPESARCTQPDARSYARSRHAVPHGVVNALINAAVAFALLPGAVDVNTLVPAKIVLGDTVITLLVLTALIVPAVATHARVDAAFKIAPAPLPNDALDTAGAVLTPLFAGFGFALLCTLVLWLVPYRPSVLVWACYRALVFGGYSAWLAERMARATLSKPSVAQLEVATRA